MQVDLITVHNLVRGVYKIHGKWSVCTFPSFTKLDMREKNNKGNAAAAVIEFIMISIQKRIV